MNNAKVWLVVSPTVGVPVFLAAVAISSFLVHVALVMNTDWMYEYHNGGAMVEEAAMIDVQAEKSTA
ncbi:light-harvesting protein B-800-850 alpha chain [Rhodovulum iodosum]|uniref:Antenna pigment protein alpha chain n=1 Tax=Rhodovulum iodosum TaxID=68291 RepID=A0ABV3XWW7_9RHOB|nr:light-harvesting protein [Rhodovulum robiginosum]RSK34093.1 light-harvesting protein [Rhodovulum robiginosum]